jgi:hypothetical protein
MLAGKLRRGHHGQITTAKEKRHMKRNLRRIVMLSATLALIALLVVSTAAFAKGPDGATQTRTQVRAVDATQTHLGTTTQSHDRIQLHQADGTCLSCTGTGSQAQNGAQAQNGSGYGAGDGTGPIGGGSFGPGPNGQCLDLNENGICDCQE